MGGAYAGKFQRNKLGHLTPMADIMLLGTSIVHSDTTCQERLGIFKVVPALRALVKVKAIP